MASTIACPKCHAQYQFEPRFAGRTIRCRRCSTLIRIDSSPQPPEQQQSQNRPAADPHDDPLELIMPAQAASPAPPVPAKALDQTEEEESPPKTYSFWINIFRMACPIYGLADAITVVFWCRLQSHF